MPRDFGAIAASAQAGTRRRYTPLSRATSRAGRSVRQRRWPRTSRAVARDAAKEPTLSAVLVLHERLAISFLLFMLAVGLWGLFSFLRGGSLSGSIAGALVIGQILIMVQGLAGIALFVSGHRPADSLHILYGIAAALVLPFVWSYMKDRNARQALLFYSLVALFAVGLAIRGIVTGG